MVLETDCLVIGGGSAGCVIAARLSEDPSTEVTLLEAGPDWSVDEVPAEIRSLNPFRALGPSVAPQFLWPDIVSRRTAAQEPAMYLRGRGLGGSSTVNGIIAVHAMPGDYDRWAAAGCRGWSYQEMLPYLTRMEADADFGSESYHGTDGPIPVMRLAPSSAHGHR